MSVTVCAVLLPLNLISTRNALPFCVTVPEIVMDVTLTVASAVLPKASVTRTVSVTLSVLPAVYSPVVALIVPPELLTATLKVYGAPPPPAVKVWMPVDATLTTAGEIDSAGGQFVSNVQFAPLLPLSVPLKTVIAGNEAVVPPISCTSTSTIR